MHLSDLFIFCQVFHENLHWQAGSHTGSFDNIHHRPGGGRTKVQWQSFLCENYWQLSVLALQYPTVSPLLMHWNQNSELRTQNLIWQHYGHIGGDRFINASRFSNGWYWNKAGEYSLTKLTKKYNLQRFNKEMMPYLVGVMMSGVPLRHIAAIIGPLKSLQSCSKPVIHL